MICSERFVWLHFPKCAGTKIEDLFLRYFSHCSGIHQDPVDEKLDPKASWHDSIHARERRDNTFVLGARTVICSIRRLPGWLESRYNFEVVRSPHLNHDPNRLLQGCFLTRTGKEVNADRVARRYLPAPLLAHSKLVFVRQEHFGEDFRQAFAPFVDISLIPPEEFQSRVNVAPNSVPIDVSKRLWSQDSDLYTYCPHWREVEKLAYPDRHA